MTSSKASVFVTTTLTIAGAAALPAHATDEDSGTLREITVSARRIQQDVQEIPISVAVLSEAELDRRGATNFEGFALSVPGLSFGTGGEGRGTARLIAIRGVGAGASVNVGDTTGFYLDDTPLPYSVDPVFIDVDHIEVLRGPQGTLYGSRSMGGAIKIITQKPNFAAYGGNFSASVADTKDGDSSWMVRGSVNVPFAENLAARIGLFSNDQGGVQDRRFNVPGSTLNPRTFTVFNTIKDVDNESNKGVIASVRWAPTERLEVLPKIIYQQTSSNGSPLADLVPDDMIQARTFNIPEPYNDNFYLGALTLNYDAGWATLTESSSVYDRNFNEREEYGDRLSRNSPRLMGAPTQGESIKDGHEKVETHELRLSTATDRRWQLITGAFYQEQTRHRNIVLTLLNATNGPALFGTTQLFTNDETTEVDEFALYGELSFKLTSRLSLIGGARWFDARTKLDRHTTGPLGGANLPRIGNSPESGVTPKFSIQYELSDAAMVYAQASEGFRLGGVNFVVPSPATCNTPADLERFHAFQARDVFDPDKLWNYELGAKTMWLDRRIRLNVSAYYIDWKNIQQNVSVCSFNLTVNAGDAVSKGFEAEMLAEVTPNLEIGLNLGYTDAKLTTTVPLVAEAGDRVQYIPDWQLSGHVQYGRPASEHWRWYALTRATYVGESFSTFHPETTPLLINHPYGEVNAKLGMINTDGLELALFANNIFDRHGSTGYNKGVGTNNDLDPRIGVNRPRTIGLQVLYRF